MNKYNAKQIKTPEGSFDSKSEYARWCELKLLERAGKISGLKRQYELTLAMGGIQGHLIWHF